MKRIPKPFLPFLVSVSIIAQRIGRTPKGVQDTIKRLKIEPDLAIPPRWRFYRVDRITEIASAMRALNGTSSRYTYHREKRLERIAKKQAINTHQD